MYTLLLLLLLLLYKLLISILIDFLESKNTKNQSTKASDKSIDTMNRNNKMGPNETPIYSQIQRPSTNNNNNNTNSNNQNNKNLSKAINEFNKIELDNALFSFQNEFASDEIQEPINKCKDLFSQLKASIQVN